MKKTELIGILDQRKKECESYLKRNEKQLKDLRAEKEIGFDREILGGIQHQIGYLNGVISEIENTKRLLNMSLSEYENEQKEVVEYLRQQKKHLRNMLKERMGK